MRYHIQNKIYHVELLPPKQESEKLEKDLELFTKKYKRVLENGYCACITDNAMGNLSFQGTEMIDVLGLPVEPEQVMIHLNTFHTKENLDEILNSCIDMGIKYLWWSAETVLNACPSSSLRTSASPVQNPLPP